MGLTNYFINEELYLILENEWFHKLILLIRSGNTTH